MGTKAQRADQVRLTPGEEALWALQRLVPGLGVSNVAVALRAPTPLRWWPLAETLRWLTARHPPLRARFPLRGDAPVRVTERVQDIDPEVDSLDIEPHQVDTALRDYAARPFDVEAELPIRVLWLRAGNRHLLCLVVHHLVIDPIGVELLVSELCAGYRALAETGEPPELPPPLTVETRPPRPESLRFWREQLAGVDPTGMRLSPARRPAGPATFASDEVDRALAPEYGEWLAALRARAQTTESAVLLAAYLVALRGLGASADAVVGVPVSTLGVAGRSGLGYHAATVPLRVSIDPEGTLADLAAALTPRLWAALEHADVSFETMARELAAGRGDLDWWRSGLVRHLFNHRSTRAAEPVDADRWPDRWEVHTGLSRFDLELIVLRVADADVFRLAYSTEVHDRQFALDLLCRIEALLREAYEHPGRSIGALDVRTPAERALLDRLNDTAVTWPGPPTVPALVSQVAAAASDAVAVQDGDRALRYGELARLAGWTQNLLERAGVRAGDVVAVAAPRGAGLAAAVLAVWRAGAAYLPIDPEQPGRWLRGQLDDAGVQVVLDGHLLPTAARSGLTCLPVPDAAPDDAAPLPEPKPLVPEDLAYLIHTSGSSGRPKGVRLTHGNLLNVIRHFADVLGAGPDTRMLWLTTFAFDISVLELLLPLCCAGRAVVAPDDVRSLPGRLADLALRERVDLVQATPTTWRAVLTGDDDWLAGRTVLCGGERMPGGLAERFRRAGCRALNVYGPTETTVWSTAADLADEDPRQLTVGRPIANTRAYVLDDLGRPRPVLVAGELCLAGAGVAEGYHDRPRLTGERFRTDRELGRHYRTGDLARLLPDGRIELLGRRDRQIKLRGHRVELDEVEAVLAEHPEVSAAAVVLCGEPDGDGYLSAFVVAQDRTGLAEDIWFFARSRLPSHELPGRVTPVDELPQTAAAKVDLAALAARETTPVAGPSAPGPGGADPDPLRRRLVEAWRDVLGLPDLGPHANFFLSGGSSLQAAVLAERISGWHDTPVAMLMIFQAPTPAALACALREKTA